MKTRIVKRAGVLGVCMIVALLAVALAPAQSQAQVLAVGTNTIGVAYMDGVPHFLRINGAAVGLPFVTTVPNQRVVVLFNAECAVRGNANTWVEIDVLIDGVLTAPSQGADNAFCINNVNPALENFDRPSMNVFRIIPAAGVHSVMVRARLANFAVGERFIIDDSTTIVMK